MAANPPATDQSGDSKGAAAAALVEAVLVELEVAVLVLELMLELVLELKASHTRRTLVAASTCATLISEKSRDYYLP